MVVTTVAASRLSLRYGDSFVKDICLHSEVLTPFETFISMRDPSHAETSAASLSRYQTTKAGGTTTFGGNDTLAKGDGVPTYPLHNLRGLHEESQLGQLHFEEDEEKGISKQNLAPGGEDVRNLPTDRVPHVYQGVYIQSQSQ